MKRVDEIMEQMGFKKEASIETKVAFVKSLFRQTLGVTIPDPSDYEVLKKEVKKYEQLSLFDDMDVRPKTKRAS
jgi:hypothetical protein